jgi:hypothetical protein
VAMSHGSARVQQSLHRSLFSHKKTVAIASRFTPDSLRGRARRERLFLVFPIVSDSYFPADPINTKSPACLYLVSRYIVLPIFCCNSRSDLVIKKGRLARSVARVAAPQTSSALVRVLVCSRANRSATVCLV